MPAIQEVNDFNTLLAQRDTWRTLLDRTADATFFQSLDWLEVYWRHYGAGQQLRVLMMSEGGQPTGILPMVVRREARKIGGINILTYLLDDWGSFYGPLGPRPGETLAAGLEYLARARGAWDVLDVRWVADLPTPRAEAEAALAAAGLLAEHEVRGTAAVVDLHGTFDEYFAQLSSKWRNNYRRWHRRMCEQGELTYTRYRPQGEAAGDGDPRWDLYDACEAIARRSWQGASETGTTLTHDSVRPFLRDAHQTAARVGALDLNLLSLDETPIAFAYNYHWRGYVYGLRVGFDQGATREGAGNLLYVQALEDSFARGDRVYDMGPGSLAAKRYLARRMTDVLQYTHFRRFALKGQLLRAAHYGRHLLHTSPWFGQPGQPA